MARLLLATAYGPREVSVEVARSEQEKQRGLMFRPSLPPRYGMLFVYDPPQEVSMWMRGTLIPLDVVFVRPDGVVSSIVPFALPGNLQRISSHDIVSAVLELAGGSTARMGLRSGDRVYRVA